VAWATLALLFPRGTDWAWPIVSVIFGPGVFIPGLGICAWRLRSHSRSFRSRMVGQHFVTMRREFSRARQIHESMFPAPYDDGFVRFEYTYSPMRELGGDYVHLHVGAAGLVHLMLLDVTGHGLAAALTVNRLHGELERIRGESPQAQPGEVLALLNRYIHLTMARHNIYATAACCTIDPYLGQLHWASAGHPPAYLRGVNGVIRNLNATTVPLGAVESDPFDPDQQDIELSPGDTIVLCTDGVFESRDRIGKQFGLSRLRELMAMQPPPRNWPSFVASAVGRHNGGQNEDDILIASLKFLKARAHETSDAEETMAAT
jgi:serine phosphatase RsbU (regulator of sigma subunit)